ncbi:MAG: cytochrome c [Bdellovibrionota bacterium]
MNENHCKKTISSRFFMMLFLLSCFAMQSWFVYSDPSGYQQPPLSPIAREGRGVWLANNCQSCHQFFGFGGFLGPDLSNRGHIFPPNALRKILKAGPGQMPSFDLSQKEAEALHHYFLAINKLGKSQPTRAEIYKGKFSLSELPWFLYE